ITRLRHRGIHGATTRYWRWFPRIVLFPVLSRRVTKLWVVSLKVPTKVPTVLGRRFLTSRPGGGNLACAPGHDRLDGLPLSLGADVRIPLEHPAADVTRDCQDGFF